MSKTSAGILAYRYTSELQFFLIHPGGPFFAKKDLGAWSIPKGEIVLEEDPLSAAVREFQEETGFLPVGEFNELGSIKQASGKTVLAWAIEFDLDEKQLVSNTFSIEWPRESGKLSIFPEVDKGDWFSEEEAKKKINSAQVFFIDGLISILKIR